MSVASIRHRHPPILSSRLVAIQRATDSGTLWARRATPPAARSRTGPGAFRSAANTAQALPPGARASGCRVHHPKGFEYRGCSHASDELERHLAPEAVAQHAPHGVLRRDYQSAYVSGREGVRWREALGRTVLPHVDEESAPLRSLTN